jgi:hypothetical protein
MRTHKGVGSGLTNTGTVSKTSAGRHQKIVVPSRRIATKGRGKKEDPTTDGVFPKQGSKQSALKRKLLARKGERL